MMDLMVKESLIMRSISAVDAPKIYTVLHMIWSYTALKDHDFIPIQTARAYK